MLLFMQFSPEGPSHPGPEKVINTTDGGATEVLVRVLVESSALRAQQWREQCRESLLERGRGQGESRRVKVPPTEEHAPCQEHGLMVGCADHGL